ncbi:MAG: hypothetical protein ACI814_003747 [Mariniblastus sp.]
MEGLGQTMPLLSTLYQPMGKQMNVSSPTTSARQLTDKDGLLNRSTREALTWIHSLFVPQPYK